MPPASCLGDALAVIVEVGEIVLGDHKAELRRPFIQLGGLAEVALDAETLQVKQGKIRHGLGIALGGLALPGLRGTGIVAVVEGVRTRVAFLLGLRDMGAEQQSRGGEGRENQTHVESFERSALVSGHRHEIAETSPIRNRILIGA